MKTLRYLTLLLTVALLGSCNFLDKEPTELNRDDFYTNETELKLALIGVYSPLGHETFYGNDYAVVLAGGDDLSFYARANPTGTAISSMILATANSSSTSIMTYWRLLYDAINRANLLLDNIDKNKSIAQSTRDEVRAEAMCLRSFYYFNLIQGWGDVPMRLTGIKYVGGNLAIARTNKQVIYDQIISDIENSIAYLPQSNQLTHTGTLTQSAAKALLARIYLFRAGEHYRDDKAAGRDELDYFAKAKLWAAQVINSNLHGLVKPYSRVFKDLSEDKYNSTGVRESIWEVEFAGNRIDSPNYSTGRIGNMIGFGGPDYSSYPEYKDKKGMDNPGYGYNMIFSTLKLYDMYYPSEEGAQQDTARGNWNIAPYKYKVATTGLQPRKIEGREYYTGRRPEGLTSVDGYPCTELATTYNYTVCGAKYRREHEVVTPKHKNFTGINFPIIRYSEVLLIYAEADNEINNGPSAFAYTCINQVRDRAYLDPLSGLNVEQFRNAIKKERAMEFCFEGHRRWDLIRWGEFYTTMQSMTSYIDDSRWGSSYRFASEQYRGVTKAYVYFPIPDWEKSKNNLMTQNYGW